MGWTLYVYRTPSSVFLEFVEECVVACASVVQQNEEEEKPSSVIYCMTLI
jgi:hypothetical protein